MRVAGSAACALLVLLAAPVLAAAQEAGPPLAAAIHAGACGDHLGEAVAPLPGPTVPTGEPTGSPRAQPAATSVGTVDRSLAALVAAPHAISVARPASRESVACGEVGGAFTAAGQLVIGLVDQGGSGSAGIAYLGPNAADPARTDVALFLSPLPGAADASAPASDAGGVPPGAARGRVGKVLSGDELEVWLDAPAEGAGQPTAVRLAGVEAPALGACYGPEAFRRARRLFADAGATVWLEPGGDQDPEGWLLRYVWSADSAGGARLANEVLVREGYAVMSGGLPDGQHAERLAAAQAAAQAAGTGLWGVCGGAGSPPQAAPLPTPAPEAATQAAVECAAFPTYDAAQTYYAANPAAQPSLDPNGDGRACEVWFGTDATAPPPPAAAPDVGEGGDADAPAGDDRADRGDGSGGSGGESRRDDGARDDRPRDNDRRRR